MKAAVQVLSVVVALLAGFSTSLWSQAVKPQSAAKSRTTQEGVYTAAQATRGEKLQMSECSMCHSPQDEFTGSAFLGKWSGKSVHDLFDMLRKTMPQETPGSLSRQQYADVVAYILKLNGMPAGRAELKGDDATLRKIVIQRKK